MESKLKNINYVRYINIIFLTLSRFTSYTYADTKMTTCCCGSCREGGNQENSSISNNAPDLLPKNNFKNYLNKKKFDKNPLENIDKNENQNFFSNNDTVYMDTEENNNNRSELNASSGINNISEISNPNKNNENSLKDINSSIEKNFNETNNTSKYKITNEITNNYNTNSLDKILNTSENNNNTNNTENDQIKIDNNPINTENNNKSQNKNTENTSIVNGNIDCGKIDELVKINKEVLEEQRKAIELRKNINEKKEKYLGLKILKQENIMNEQNLINDLNTYIQNGYGLGKEHRDLTSIYNDYVKEYGNKYINKYINTQKKEDIIKLINKLIEFFNNKKEKVENLMNTLNSQVRFTENFDVLNKSINDELKKDHVNNYDEIFKADRETYNDYLSLIEKLGKINIINTEDKNKIYNYFSKLEICYQAVKKELETINQEIIEINYTNKNNNSLDGFLKNKNIEITEDKVYIFKILKNSEISLEYNKFYVNNINKKIQISNKDENEYVLLITKNNKNGITLNIAIKKEIYKPIINIQQNIRNDIFLKIPFYNQSYISTLKCTICKEPEINNKKNKDDNKKAHRKSKSNCIFSPKLNNKKHSYLKETKTSSAKKKIQFKSIIKPNFNTGQKKNYYKPFISVNKKK